MFDGLTFEMFDVWQRLVGPFVGHFTALGYMDTVHVFVSYAIVKKYLRQ